jgi:drug/metabolite transporter (DMT)-like permease
MKELLIGIFAYLAYAIASALDKYFLNKGFKPFPINTVKMFFDALFIFIFGIYFFSFSLNLKMIFIVGLMGFLYASSGVIYFVLLKHNHAQRLVPLIQGIEILMIFVGAIITLNEPFKIINLFGMIVLLSGILILFDFKLNRELFYYTIVLALISTVYSLMAKRFLMQYNPVEIGFLMYLSSALFMMLFTFIKGEGAEVFKLKNFNILKTSFFGSLGTFLLYIALMEGFASKIYPLAGLMPVFLFFISGRFLKEGFSWKQGLRILLITIGIFFVSL